MINLPSRLHHTAYVSNDLEATRAFYENVIGLPLTACWTEADHLFGKDRVYCHLFFDLADGSSLAFFQFADPEDQAEFGPQLAPSAFRHVALKVDDATQAEIEGRIAKAGITAPATYVLEHGYCRSVYVEDPNGMILEFCRDDPRAADSAADRRAKARNELDRWLAGDHKNNNLFRAAEV